jgi:hypothetical protein
MVLAGCAEGQRPAAGAASEGLAPAPPDVELRDAKSAMVAGHEVPLDGVTEGLSWPALDHVVHRGARAVVVISAPRDVPVATVLRAVWTLRDATVRLQTTDAAGAPRVLELRPKPDVPTETGCHLAVFVRPNGDLRVAAPGGPQEVSGHDAGSALARALAEERARCTIRYIAFGATDESSPWGAVFDLARTVDREKSAGDTRYVLAEPLR